MAHCRPCTQIGLVRAAKIEKKESNPFHSGKVVEGKKAPQAERKNSNQTGSKKSQSSNSNSTKDGKSNNPALETQTSGGGDASKVRVVKEFTARLLGSRSSGKTTLLKKIGAEELVSEKKTNSSTGTVLDETISVSIDEDASAIIRLLDIPDCENNAIASVDGDEVQPIVQFDKVDLFLVVYSVVDFSSVIFARACLRQLKKSCSSFSKSLPPVIILVANKMDLAQSANSNAPEINFVVSRTEGLDIAKKNSCKFAEVSALTGQNLPQLLVGIVRQLNLRDDRAVSGGRIARAISNGPLGRFFGFSKTGKSDDLLSP